MKRPDDSFVHRRPTERERETERETERDRERGGGRERERMCVCFLSVIRCNKNPVHLQCVCRKSQTKQEGKKMHYGFRRTPPH